MSHAQSIQTPSKWLINGPADALLFVAAPLWIVPAVLLANERVPQAQLALIVAAFGATGHHLPGMLRAYGDRALFQRFRTRFIWAPLFLVTICVGSYALGYTGIGVMVLAWGLWHGLMQTFGFLRIYDGKMGVVDSRSARLDFWMCLSWFVFGFLTSDHRTFALMDLMMQSGVNLPSRLSAQLFYGLFALIVTIITITWFMQQWRLLQSGKTSPVKWALMVSSIGFWWFAMIWPSNIILGVAMFEIFHDVQYLAIVWLFNRNQVNQGRSVGGFTRFLFRKRFSLVILYLALVLTYGAWDFVDTKLLPDTWAPMMVGLMVASALLHFYYDGFIWKVHEAHTAQTLGLQRQEKQSRAVRLPWKWAYLVVPLMIMGVLQHGELKGKAERLEALQTLMPHNPVAHLSMGQFLRQQGDLTGARIALERAVALNPGYAEAWKDLAHVLFDMKDWEQGVFALGNAKERDALDGDALYAYAHGLRQTGAWTLALDTYEQALARGASKALVFQGMGLSWLGLNEIDRAQECFEEALQTENQATSMLNLAVIQVTKGHLEEANSWLERAYAAEPENVDVLIALSRSLMGQGVDTEVVTHLEHVLKIQPEHVEANQLLGALYVVSNEPEKAVPYLEQAIRTRPTVDALVGLGQAKLLLGDYDQADKRLSEALEMDANHAEAWFYLGLACQKRGMLTAAEAALDQAITHDARMRSAHLARMQLAVYGTDWLNLRHRALYMLEVFPDDPDGIRALQLANRELGR